jgi:hypothetical protein
MAMATMAPKQNLPIGTVQEARNLAARFVEGDAFRSYVRHRKYLVIPALLLILAIALSSTVASVVFAAGTRPLFVLMALILAPIVVLGSLFVQVYVFFAWLEGRALARMSAHRPKPARGKLATWLASNLHADLGDPPPVPWALAVFFVVAPMAILAYVAIKLALALTVLAVLAPVLYSRFDR